MTKKLIKFEKSRMRLIFCFIQNLAAIKRAEIFVERRSFVFFIIEDL